MSKSIEIENFNPFLLTLYRDFKLCELYKYNNDCDSKLPSKLSVVWGDSDEYIQSEKPRIIDENVVQFL